MDRESQGRYLSRWSIASLILFGLAIFFFLLPGLALPHSAAGPAEAAALLVQRVFCFLVAWSCTLLGAVAGWFGVRRSRGKLGVAWAGLVLNSWHCFLAIVLTILTYVFGVNVFYW